MFFKERQRWLGVMGKVLRCLLSFPSHQRSCFHPHGHHCKHKTSSGALLTPGSATSLWGRELGEEILP